MKTKQFELSPNFISEIYNSSVSLLNIEDEMTSILEAISADWLRFVKEPVSLKKLFVVGKERGWVGRNGEPKKEGGQHDIKEFFHFHADFIQRLNQKSGKVGNKYNNLLQNLKKIHELCVDASMEIATQFEKRFLGKNLLSKIKVSTLNHEHVVRLLYYPTQPLRSKEDEKKDGLAQAHFDRDLWTFSLLENLPGLRLGAELENPHTYQRNKVLVFPGTKFDHLTNGVIKVVNHGVINFMSGDRIAIVFFFHSSLAESIVKNHALKRRREMEKEITTRKKLRKKRRNI